MADEFSEADVRREVAALGALLGETRLRFHNRQTRLDSSDQLIEIDREIRDAIALPLSAALQGRVRRLTARLRALDPHQARRGSAPSGKVLREKAGMGVCCIDAG